MANDFSYDSARPSERARYWYDAAQSALNRISASVYRKDMDLHEMIRVQSWAMRNQFFGDQAVAEGLRATYILLKKIDERLDRIERAKKP